MSKMVQTVIDCFELPEMPDKEVESAKKKAKTKEDVAKSAQEKFSQVAKDTQEKQKGATELMDLTVEAGKEAPNELYLTNSTLKDGDDNEPDELDHVPASKKTKEGYLKDGFVVDDKHVMDEEQKRRLHAPFGSRLGDGAEKEQLQDTPPSSPANGDKKAYSDDCSTPDIVIQVLVDNYLKANYRPTAKIWEIACGSEQKIVKYLQTAGFTNVTYSDIQGEAIGVTKHDFLEEGQGLYQDHEYDLAITNPPWSQSRAFIQLGKSNPQLLQHCALAIHLISFLFWKKIR
jgi:methylase of polypeptide subunit release factors